MYINSLQTHALEKIFLNLCFLLKKKSEISKLRKLSAKLKWFVAYLKRDAPLVSLDTTLSSEFNVVILTQIKPFER